MPKNGQGRRDGPQVCSQTVFLQNPDLGRPERAHSFLLDEENNMPENIREAAFLCEQGKTETRHSCLRRLQQRDARLQIEIG